MYRSKPRPFVSSPMPAAFIVEEKVATRPAVISSFLT
jgi:hypothetical protein